MEKMKKELRDQILVIENDLAQQKTDLQILQVRVFDMESDLSRMRAALDALEGNKQVAKVFPGYVISRPTVQPGLVVPVDDLKKVVTLNGELIELETGFHIAKNSLGEECIVPDGVYHAPMAEPEKPEATRIVFPTLNEGFDKPENLL